MALLAAFQDEPFPLDERSNEEFTQDELIQEEFTQEGFMRGGGDGGGGDLFPLTNGSWWWWLQHNFASECSEAPADATGCKPCSVTPASPSATQTKASHVGMH